jgi:N-acetylglucosaminyldiphosphoundecaprenol N-acetyl-beta-D-mannosaminyltransferase
VVEDYKKPIEDYGGGEKRILGVKVNFDVSMNDVLSRIENSMLKDGESHYICTTNPEFVIDCQKDNEFMQIVNGADLSVPDGVGLLLAHEYQKRMVGFRMRLGMISNKSLRRAAYSCLFPAIGLAEGVGLGFEALVLGRTFGDRVQGVKLAEELCRLSSEKGYSVYFLGGRAKNWLGKPVDTCLDLATRAAESTKNRYKNVHIIGSTSQFSRDSKDDDMTVETIKKSMQNAGVSRLDFLFVAYNHNSQEKWIKRNISKIPANLAIGVGGTFDYLAGIKMTSPYIMRKRGLEWLFRLFTQPWRFKRILSAFLTFPLKIFVEEISKY